MNAYLDQIYFGVSMEKKADNKNEARDVAVIGALGTASGIISNHVTNKFELNGKISKPKPLLKNTPKFTTNPLKAAKAMLKSKGFKNNLKIGAIGGTVGLIGDYAAVKINKALEKKAMNKFLEKIAESYQVEGHRGLGHGVYHTPKINLNRPEYHNYASSIENNSVKHLPIATTALGALAGRAHATLKGTRLKGLSTLAGATGGMILGKHISRGMAHNTALESMKMVHPNILPHYED